MVFVVKSKKELQEAAQELARLATPGTAVLIEGGVGAGKTTLVTQVLKRIGVKETLGSPTYAVVHEYRTKAFRIYHIDLYQSSQAQIDTGFLDDYFQKDAVSFVEWPEKLPKWLLLEKTVRVQILSQPDGSRQITVVE